MENTSSINEENIKLEELDLVKHEFIKEEIIEVKAETIEYDKVNLNEQFFTDNYEHIKLEQQLHTELIIKEEENDLKHLRNDNRDCDKTFKLKKCLTQNKAFRGCFVPLCPNTTSKQPEKLYFSMPTDMAIRKKWFDRAHRKGPIGKRNYYCCEDHFVLSEDMMDYMRFKLMGKLQKLRIKRGVFPHLFECQDRKTEFSPVTTRSARIEL
ncbi:uncharacterized protein LOC123297000 [Chrysoperla carnea]|uniref:uncharacterized protein LOC123297000 n=1 Tax=Chrysoperla carnea TaxID=189513 RepID=UPI001D05E273|nr:uncharacterized protein LOC123297000 [Chrysoperla carnea]